MLFLRELFWDTASVSLKCGLVSNIVFWVASLVGLCVDQLAASQRYPLLTRCKLQPQQHLSRTERLDLILLSSFNMIVIALLICCPIFEWMWNHASSQRLLESDEILWQHELFLKMPVNTLITELSFYSVHTLLHYSPFLYRHIHKVHHRFIAPTAMACVYAHPLEFAIGNIFPIYLGPMMTNLHPLACYWVWFPLAMLGTCIGHCGYRILGHIDPHDVHHLYGKYNYGGMCLADLVLGTTKPHPTGTDDKKAL